MFSWDKLGKVFDPTQASTPTWMNEFTQAPCVLEQSDAYRVYFACRPKPDAAGNYVSLSGYVDLDKRDPMQVLRISPQPLLPLGDPGCFDEFGTYFTSVVRHGDEVWAYYVGYTRCVSVPFTINIGLAISRDGGNTFTRAGKGPLLPCTLDEPFFLTVPRVKHIDGVWYMWYSAGKRWRQAARRPEPVYRIRMATSTDGINWKKQGRDLLDRVIDEDECQACPDVFRHKGRYYMAFCYRASVDYHGKNGGYRLGCAVSDDLLHWQRDDRWLGLDISDSGWDSEMICFPHVFQRGTELNMLYLGNQMGRHGFGMARLIHSTFTCTEE